MYHHAGFREFFNIKQVRGERRKRNRKERNGEKEEDKNTGPRSLGFYIIQKFSKNK